MTGSLTTRTVRTALLGALLALAALAGVAGAHAYLESSTPANGSTVAEPQSEITLVMNETVEIRFSIFKVYPFDIDPAMSLRELADAATALVEEALPRRGDEDLRADVGVVTEERSSNTITLALREDLAPGTYLVMWRVLSVDTHSTDAFMLFTFDPAAADDPDATAGD